MQVILHVTTWMNLKDFMQGERCLNQKNHTVWFHMYEHRSLVTGNITAVAWAGCWEEKLTIQGLEGTFLVDGEGFYFFLSWLKQWLHDDTICQEPSTLKCVNFIVCKLQLSKVDFTKTNPWWSESHIPQTCLWGLFLSDEISGALLSCWLPGAQSITHWLCLHPLPARQPWPGQLSPVSCGSETRTPKSGILGPVLAVSLMSCAISEWTLACTIPYNHLPY